MVITPIRGLITPSITTHEAPSWGVRFRVFNHPKLNETLNPKPKSLDDLIGPPKKHISKNKERDIPCKPPYNETQ